MCCVKTIAGCFEQLPQILRDGDAARLIALFDQGKVCVNVPRYGQIGNNIVFGRYLKKVWQWIQQREDMRWEYFGAFHDEAHLALNAVLYFTVRDEEFNYRKELHIPVSVMCELKDGAIKAARVYYSTYWIAGHNIVRPALLNEDPSLMATLPDKERLYFECLWKGDSDTILREVIDPNAYFMGTAYSYNQGPDLIKTFNGLFSGGRNTELRLCSAFSAQGHLIIEYMNHRSGGNPNTPSAGMAIYGYTPEGKIAYVRLAGDSLFDHCLWPTL